MPAHGDILDQQERLSRPLAGSLLMHVSIAAALVAYNWIASRAPVTWGDPNGGGIGSVVVTPVSSIKLPSRGPENPVANDTESMAPEAPSKKKAEQKAKAPEPDAIPIKSRRERKRAMETASSQPNKFREKQQDLPNQVYSSGQAVSSRMYNMDGGGGGLQLGSDSPFGTEFGWYAKLLRDKVAQNWKTAELNNRQSLPPVTITFVIQRDGTLKGQVQIAQRSGNTALDYSAQRAVLDSAPFSALPPQFAKNEAKVELLFNLK